jgi:hypothetical protein
MTPTDHIDNSVCNSFILMAVADMSDAVVLQFIEDLKAELKDREGTK